MTNDTTRTINLPLSYKKFYMITMSGSYPAPSTTSYADSIYFRNKTLTNFVLCQDECINHIEQNYLTCGV